MKKVFFCIFMVLCTLNASAQESTTNRDFYFVYVDHEINTPIQRLIDRLKSQRRDISQTNASAIFYLPAGDQPVIVRMNLKDDNAADFDTLFVRELQEKNSHDVIAQIDIDKIVELFDENPIVGDDHQLLYSTVNFDFYVGEKFWNLKNNELVIAKLYFILGLDKFPSGKVPFNIWKNKDEKIDVSPETAFGKKNLGGLNQRLRLQNY